MGVLAAFRDHQDRFTVHRAQGASCGALVAAASLTSLPTSWLLEQFQEVMTRAGSSPLGPFSSSFDLTSILREALESSLPPDAHTHLSGRLGVSLTDTRLRNTIATHFPTRSCLISALCCSCYLPVFSGPSLPTFQGRRFLDGGFTDSLPGAQEKDTVLVSPFTGKHKHICPQEQLPQASVTLSKENMFLSKGNLVRMVQAVRPYSQAQADRYYQQGLEDAARFIQENMS